jgi:hypothetical protein
LANANSTHSAPAAKLTREIADEMTTDVIHYLKDTLLPKYGVGGADIYTAMEAIYREWCGAEGVVVPVELKERSATLWRLRDWSERNGCSVEEAAHLVLVQWADLALPTPEEDAELDAKLAEYESSGAKDRMEQALDRALGEATPLPTPKKNWGPN